jgi:DNA-binding HxlR family transcriptional regulator
MKPKLAIVEEVCGPGPDCPVTKAVRTLDGKWKLHLIYQLMDGTKRFSQLQRAVPKITQQMLAAQLRQLEADGVVLRVVYPQVPPKVEYSLTPLGQQLQAVTDALAAWGTKLPSPASDSAS